MEDAHIWSVELANLAFVGIACKVMIIEIIIKIFIVLQGNL
jgi:hypothetical protein